MCNFGNECCSGYCMQHGAPFNTCEMPPAGMFGCGTTLCDLATQYCELTFSDVVGTVQQSHIHIAQRGVSGAIVIWLCQTATSPAPAAVAGMTPMCPQSGKVTGTITAPRVLDEG